MNELIPGTRIPSSGTAHEAAQRILDSLFLGDGLVLSQVCEMIGVEAYTVQNWVKRGFVSNPVAKKYSRHQFCRLITIQLLKDCMSIPQICSLLSYINGDLADESDDRVGDDELYLYFLQVLQQWDAGQDYREATLRGIIAQVITGYRSPTGDSAEAQSRLIEVLTIMAIAYQSASLRHRAEELLAACPQKG